MVQRSPASKVGICGVIWIANLSAMTNQSSTQKYKRSGNFVIPSGNPVYTVREILNFPQDYHAKGVLSLPYGDIVEPFEAWYSNENKMSRIDYYGGMDQTYQREKLGKHGFACKVVPEFSENSQKTFRGCLHRRGTKRFPVKAQSIVPTSHYFKYVGDVTLRGRRSAKWEHKFTIYNKVNTYILYTTKDRNVKPLRYEMMGYDTLLSSYYDHYVLDYELFEPWNFNYSTFQIPTDLDCFDFTRKKFAHIVGELNPMLEFMPHTDNGAPFTFSHEPAPLGTSSKMNELEVDYPSESRSYPSEGLDATVDDDEGLTKDDYGLSSTDNEGASLASDDSLIRNTDISSSQIPESSSKIFQVSNYKTDHEYNNEDTISNYNLQKRMPYHGNLKYGGNSRFFQENQPNFQNFNKPRTSQVPDLLRYNGVFRSILHKNTKINSKGPKSQTNFHVNHGRTLYSWGNSKKPKHNVHLLREHSSTFRRLNKKQKRHRNSRKNYSNVHSHVEATVSPNYDSILRKNYEDIVNMLFEAFKVDHKKAYSSGHEHETRKDIYRHNLRFILSRNRMHLGYKLRPNHLMDMTDDEIQRQKGLLGEDENIFNGGVPFKPMSHHIPVFVDWRAKGAVNSVKSQGICGSCYAYAVTGALEGAYFLKNGHLPDFSEQEIIDCSWGFGNRGCKGGYPYRAMQWILKHGGLATDDSYGKYLAQEGYCHFQNVTVGVTVDSYMNIGKGNATELKQALAQYGPVSVLISTQPKSFKFYSSGIYYDPECGTNLDHAALAVGYGVHSGTPYWLVKNSWSKAWGDSGYIKIAQRGNNCGVTSKAVVVKIK